MGEYALLPLPFGSPMESPWHQGLSHVVHRPMGVGGGLQRFHGGDKLLAAISGRPMSFLASKFIMDPLELHCGARL